jgi:hypothetical protein
MSVVTVRSVPGTLPFAGAVIKIADLKKILRAREILSVVVGGGQR